MFKSFYQSILSSLTAFFRSFRVRVHTWLRSSPGPLSSFLPHHSKLVKRPDTSPFHYSWVAKKIPPFRYIRIAPVDTAHLRMASSWANFDLTLAGGLQGDIDEVADYMQKVFIREFAKIQSPDYFTLTDDPKEKDCLVLETAIVAIAPTGAALNAIGYAAEWAVPFISIVTSKLSEGSIGIECRIRHAKKGHIVAMYATTECDETALISLAPLTWLGCAYNNIEKVARLTALCFNVEDCYAIERDFPIQLLSLYKSPKKRLAEK